MDLVVAESDAVDGDLRRRLRALWDKAFGARFDDHDAGHAYGGAHVIACTDDETTVVAHASAVPRDVRFGDGAWVTIGYVEAVAVEPALQGHGVGSWIMQILQREIDVRWPLAMLSTSASAFYESLGWQRWGGLSYTRTANGEVADDEHGGLMIRGRDRTSMPDLTASVTCIDRPGDAW